MAILAGGEERYHYVIPKRMLLASVDLSLSLSLSLSLKSENISIREEHSSK